MRTEQFRRTHEIDETIMCSFMAAEGTWDIDLHVCTACAVQILPQLIADSVARGVASQGKWIPYNIERDMLLGFNRALALALQRRGWEEKADRDE